MIKILVFIDIQVVGFYEYISKNFDKKIIDKIKLMKTYKNIKKNFKK